jgi:protein-S-isoprenylcysteine O-methyltransferase Ste14
MEGKIMLETFQGMKDVLFMANLIIHYTLLVGAVWSVVFPDKRIWPPPNRNSWQYSLTWILFILAFILTGLFIFIDWNSWIFTQHIRFFLGIPVALVGTLLVSWGIYTLGAKNTSGLKDGFKTSGPYRFTRNPQYLGDMLLFSGIILISNSLYVFITNMLLILVFAITPLAEEVWLEEIYLDAYKQYKRITTRFL